MYLEKPWIWILCKGQGAGIAAAVGIKTGKNTHDVAIDDVQAELKKQNVKFKWNKRDRAYRKSTVSTMEHREHRV